MAAVVTKITFAELLRRCEERRASRAKGGTFSTSDVAWPGWRAEFDGRALPIVTVNGALVGIFVPPGEGVLRLRYSPSGFRYGAIVSLVALGLMLVKVRPGRQQETIEF